MKVILNEEVVGLGEPGKIVDVAPGYARNFLVPRKLAVYANTGNVNAAHFLARTRTNNSHADTAQHLLGLNPHTNRQPRHVLATSERHTHRKASHIPM